MTNHLVLLKIILITLFLVCLLDMPYSYFQIVRTVGMLGFLYLGFNAHENKQKEWKYFFWGSALLINPLIKVSLGRELWNVVDIIWAIVLGFSIWKDLYSTKEI